MTMISRFAVPSRRTILIGTGALTLGGCAGNLIGPPSPAPQIYALEPPFGAVTDAPNVDWQLVVTSPVAPAVLDTPRIALEHAPNLMDYYANSQWTDRLPLVLQALMVQAFEASGRIRAVGRATAGIRADYVLETELRNFEAYYAVPDVPPKIRVRMTARLLGALNREIAGITEASQELPAAANDITNITAAFARAAGTMVSQIVTWSLRTPRATRAR